MKNTKSMIKKTMPCTMVQIAKNSAFFSSGQHHSSNQAHDSQRHIFNLIFEDYKTKKPRIFDFSFIFTRCCRVTNDIFYDLWWILCQLFVIT